MPRPSKEQTLLKHGVRLAVKFGSSNVTRRMVAQAAKVSDPLVSHYFGPTEQLRDRLAKAVKDAGRSEPSADAQATIGEKMRKKPRRVTA